jgi:hypothetical protein
MQKKYHKIISNTILRNKQYLILLSIAIKIDNDWLYNSGTDGIIQITWKSNDGIG